MPIPVPTSVPQAMIAPPPRGPGLSLFSFIALPCRSPKRDASMFRYEPVVPIRDLANGLFRIKDVAAPHFPKLARELKLRVRDKKRDRYAG